MVSVTSGLTTERLLKLTILSRRFRAIQGCIHVVVSLIVVEVGDLVISCYYK